MKQMRTETTRNIKRQMLNDDYINISLKLYLLLSSHSIEWEEVEDIRSRQ